MTNADSNCIESLELLLMCEIVKSDARLLCIFNRVTLCIAKYTLSQCLYLCLSVFYNPALCQNS